MLYLKDIIRAFELAAPFALQEDYDNSGIQLGSPEKQVTKCLTCLDVTPEVLEEALSHGCDLIVSHHPLLFAGLKRITGAHAVEKVLVSAIKHDIAIMSVHTNLDAASQGVNAMLASKLGLENTAVMQPVEGVLKKLVTFCPTAQAGQVRSALFAAGAGHIGNYDSCSYNTEGYGTFRAGEGSNPFAGNQHELHHEPEVRIETIYPAFLEKTIIEALLQSHPYEEVAYDLYKLDQACPRAGMGLTGYFSEPMDAMRFLDHVREVLQVPILRYAGDNAKQIRKVALSGGAGSFLLGRARAVRADAFITADLKYHQFFDARENILLVDAGHYETEQFTKELLAKIIQEKFCNFAVRISTTNTNPVKYH